jgi:hypothetical protein
MIRVGFWQSASCYAPTAGRLAAAIATNWAMPRLIWAGAERSNELTRCIEKILSHRRRKSSQDHGAKRKMVRLKGRVEVAAKIATSPSPGSGPAAVLLRDAPSNGQILLFQDQPLTAAIPAQTRTSARSA